MDQTGGSSDRFRLAHSEARPVPLVAASRGYGAASDLAPRRIARAQNADTYLDHAKTKNTPVPPNSPSTAVNQCEQGRSVTKANSQVAGIHE